MVDVEQSAVRGMLDSARDALTVRRVFGDPIERDGVTVVPAAHVRGGVGGGSGSGPDGGGSGGGFGMTAHPAGAFVLRGDELEWHPAMNRERVALAGIALAALAILTVRSFLGSRAKVALAVGAS
jgi:uncharacterized spore protein YtfJ